MKTKKAIEVMELYLKVSDDFYDVCRKQGQKVSKGRLKFRADVKKSTNVLIGLAKQIEAVSGVMPKKKKFYKHLYEVIHKRGKLFECKTDFVKGYNQARDECILAFALHNYITKMAIML